MNPTLAQMRKTCSEMKRNDHASGKPLLAQLSHIRITSRNLSTASRLLALLVTVREKTPVVKGNDGAPLPPAWVAYRELAPPHVKVSMDRWEKRRVNSGIVRTLFRLYADNFRNTRTVVHQILDYQPPIPYIDILILHAMNDLYRVQFVTNRDVAQEQAAAKKFDRQVRKLLSDDAFLAWIKSRKTHVRHYSGTTNTILGLYDWIAYQRYSTLTGFDQFPKNAEAYYDLGGGFATPDIVRLTGRQFTSLDPCDPKNADSWNIQFQTLQKWALPHMGIAESAAHRKNDRIAYLSSLKRIPWIAFDIFRDHIPSVHNSYFITSFGFLSSTVRSLSDNAPYEEVAERGARFYLTTFMAIWRILELVALGKSVDVFTYQRASAVSYRYRTIFLSFRNHRLVTARVWPNSDKDLENNKYAAFLLRTDPLKKVPLMHSL